MLCKYGQSNNEKFNENEKLLLYPLDTYLYFILEMELFND